MRRYAIVAAAGRGTRLGGEKLLLPIGAETVVDRVLRAWRQSAVDNLVVVTRGDDLPLQEVCTKSGVEVVCLDAATPDMKATVLQGVRHIESKWAPGDDAICLISPADLPKLSTKVIDQVIADFNPLKPTLVVPRAGGRRGHPLLLPWIWRRRLHDLSDDEGINALMSRLPTREICVNHQGCVDDLDTRADYERILREVNDKPM